MSRGANDCSELERFIDGIRQALSTETDPREREILRAVLGQAERNLERCRAGEQPGQAPLLLESTGRVTFLRVHEQGTGYGPEDDFIDVEAVVKLDSEPMKAFGFRLRDEAELPARQGMLDLLRDAFAHDWTTTLDYSLVPGKRHGIVLRAWVTR